MMRIFDNNNKNNNYYGRKKEEYLVNKFINIVEYKQLILVTRTSACHL